eukprot:5606673-Pleurochrysis_carterae.AAC.1
MGSKMHPENGAESHLNSSFSSAAASYRPASSAPFLRFFSRYLNHFSKPTDFLLAPCTFPLPFLVNAADRRFSVLSQACGTGWE